MTLNTPEKIADWADKKTPKKKMLLRKRHLDFIREYVSNGGNGTQAVLAAGYGVKGARSQAVRLLTNVNIVSAIRDTLDAEGVTPMWITERFKRECDDDNVFARLKALESLAKIRQMFVDKTEIDIKDERQVQDVAKKMQELRKRYLAESNDDVGDGILSG